LPLGFYEKNGAAIVSPTFAIGFSFFAELISSGARAVCRAAMRSAVFANRKKSEPIFSQALRPSGLEMLEGLQTSEIKYLVTFLAFSV